MFMVRNLDDIKEKEEESENNTQVSFLPDTNTHAESGVNRL